MVKGKRSSHQVQFHILVQHFRFYADVTRRLLGIYLTSDNFILSLSHFFHPFGLQRDITLLWLLFKGTLFVIYIDNMIRWIQLPFASRCEFEFYEL